jgi:hypothetical protein
MDKKAYQRYVKTDCWLLRREAYLKLHTSCETCGQVTRLQVHHLTYERFGHEADSDMIAVCLPCHRCFHNLPNATPKGWVVQRAQYLADPKKRELALKMLGVSA